MDSRQIYNSYIVILCMIIFHCGACFAIGIGNVGCFNVPNYRYPNRWTPDAPLDVPTGRNVALPKKSGISSTLSAGDVGKSSSPITITTSNSLGTESPTGKSHSSGETAQETTIFATSDTSLKPTLSTADVNSSTPKTTTTTILYIPSTVTEELPTSTRKQVHSMKTSLSSEILMNRTIAQTQPSSINPMKKPVTEKNTQKAYFLIATSNMEPAALITTPSISTESQPTTTISATVVSSSTSLFQSSESVSLRRSSSQNVNKKITASSTPVSSASAYLTAKNSRNTNATSMMETTFTPITEVSMPSLSTNEYVRSTLSSTATERINPKNSGRTTESSVFTTDAHPPVISGAVSKYSSAISDTRMSHDLKSRSSLVSFTTLDITRPLPTISTKTTPLIIIYLSSLSHTNKFTIQNFKSAQQKLTLTADSLSNPASEETSTGSKDGFPTVAIISISVAIMLCVTGSFVYYMRKQNYQRKTKRPDDSDVRFLTQNEVLEYSNGSVLDKILIL